VIPVPPENAEGWHPIPLPDVLLGVDQSTMQAFLAFQAAVDAHEELVLQDLSRDGTQPSQITMLRLIATYEGLCQRDLADLLKISRARVTTVLQTLEEMGAIRRVRDGDDQRLTRVYLTDIGRAMDQSKETIRSNHINAVFGLMSEKERAQLRESMGTVTRLIRALMGSVRGSPAAED
jgi:MarR family transcriptional regulator, organic hydroperoxide resistance regulator